MAFDKDAIQSLREAGKSFMSGPPDETRYWNLRAIAEALLAIRDAIQLGGRGGISVGQLIARKRANAAIAQTEAIDAVEGSRSDLDEARARIEADQITRLTGG